jgi:hypothetical protein
MKTTLHKILFFLSVLPMIAVANPNHGKDRYEKSKTINKEFNVNANALLKINNKYGNVDVISWNENRVVIEVKITTSGNNESKVIAKLNEISVDFANSSSQVYAKTIFEKSSGWGNNNSNVNFRVDYKVKMPITNQADFTNDYGSISLNELKGKAAINCDYGKIIIGSLFHENNSINIDYTNNSTITFINGGDVNADYSELTIEKAKRIDLNADYTKSTVENVEDLNFNCDYGKLDIGNANKIFGDGDYLTMNFDTVFKDLEVIADYGNFRLNKLKNGFSNLKVNADYTGVKIGIESGAAFDFMIKTGYGGFDMDIDNASYAKKIVKSNSKYFEGFVLKENSNSKVEITTSYGGVTIFNN